MAKRYGYPLGLVGVTALLVFFAFHVDAAILTFDNRDSWESALQGGIHDQVNFNSFLLDTSFASGAINFGPFALSTIGIPPDGTNKIDVSPFDDDDDPSVDGTPYASMFLDSTRRVAIDFGVPMLAFGGDFFGGAAINFSVFLVGRRGAEFVDGPELNEQFFGIISTEGFNQIMFWHEGPTGTSSNVRLDNVAISETPEPSSLLLMGMGIALLGSYSCWRLRRERIEVSQDQT